MSGNKRNSLLSKILRVILLVGLLILLPKVYPYLTGGGNDDSSLEDNGIIAGSSSAVPTDFEKLELPYLLEPDEEKNTIIEHMGYTVSYNSRLRIPNWVAYEFLDSELYGDFERREEFTPDPDFKGRQAYDTDYRGSGWDRGHLAPSGDMKWSSQVQKESFYLTNVCPQNHNLNSGLWNDLEKQVRYETRYYGSVWVVTGPVVETGRYGTIGSNKVAVPDGFFKALLAKDKKSGKYVSIGFYFPNESGGRNLADYAMSVDDLEEIVGMDLFYNLDYSVQEDVESVFDPWDWRIGD